MTRSQTTSTGGSFKDERSDWIQTAGSGLGDDFDGVRSEICDG